MSKEQKPPRGPWRTPICTQQGPSGVEYIDVIELTPATQHAQEMFVLLRAVDRNWKLLNESHFAGTSERLRASIQELLLKARREGVGDE